MMRERRKRRGSLAMPMPCTEIASSHGNVATKSSGKPESDNPYRRAIALPLVSSSHSSVSQLVRNESAMSTQKKASTT